MLASNEDRTRDLALTTRMLCQLSYRGETPATTRVTSGNAWVSFGTKKDAATRNRTGATGATSRGTAPIL